MGFQQRVAGFAAQEQGKPFFYATTERLKPFVLDGGLKTRHLSGDPTNLTLFANPVLAAEHGASTLGVKKEAVVLIEVNPLAVKLPNDLGLRGQRGGPLGGFRPENGIPPHALRASRTSAHLAEYEDTGIAMRR